MTLEEEMEDKHVSEDLFRAEFCAERLKALSDPHRIRIVDLLRHGELTVSDISEFLNTEVVNISHHLKILKNAQLVNSRREGRFKYYSLDADLFTKSRKANQYLDLGCCRIEVPHHA